MAARRTVTLLCSAEGLADLAPALDSLEAEFAVAIRRYSVSGEERLPVEQLAEVEMAALIFGEDPGPVLRNVLRKEAASLRALFVGWVGLDAPFFEKLRSRGVRLYNSPGVNAPGIALNVAAAVLMIERRMLHYLEAQQAREWSRLPEAEDPSRRDVAGLTAVIFGFGSIGAELARLLKAMGMRVIGVRRSPMRPGDPADEMLRPEDLPAAAKRADWLLCCAPLEDSTRNAVSREVLAALPHGAGFANVGRGGIVDEEALIEALQAGRLRGAYLDVFQTEPLPPDSPLWSLPNVVVTPHNASGALGNRARSLAILRANIAAWLGEEAAASSRL